MGFEGWAQYSCVEGLFAMVHVAFLGDQREFTAFFLDGSDQPHYQSAQPF